MLNLEKSPLTKLILLTLSFIGQACSPFSGHVNEKLSDNYYYSKTKTEIRYSPMGNWFELGNSKIQDADVASFEVLGRDFAKDKNHIFYKEYIIDSEVDYDSFKSYDYYCTDKNHVYIPEQFTQHVFYDNDTIYSSPTEKALVEKNKSRKMWIIQDADPLTYIEIDSDWAKDKSNFFYRHLPVSVDYETFKILNKSFCLDKNSVYAVKMRSLLSVTIDPTTVEKVDENYVLDKHAVYFFEEFQDSKITNKLFAHSYKNKEKIHLLNKEYLQIDESILYENVALDNVDVSTFQLLNPTWYAKDKKQVYCAGKVIKNADPNTFQIFENAIYAKDKKQVYCRGNIIIEADVETFGPPTKKYSFRYRDKNHIYLEDKITTEE